MSLLLIILVVFFITQLGYHWWPDWSLVRGVRIDYLSPTIFASDIFLVIFLLIVFLTFKKKGFSIRIKLPPAFIWLTLYLLIISLKSKFLWLSLYWSGRYLQPFIISFAIAVLLKCFSGDKKSGVNFIKNAVALSIVFLVGLSSWQILSNRSSGWFWALGERDFNLSTPNIAKLTLWGKTFLRPYATFSHPNALAGWLLAAGLFLEGRNNFGKFAKILAGIGIFFSGSKTAILTAIIAILITRIKSLNSAAAKFMFFLWSSVSVLAVWSLTTINLKSSILERFELAKSALAMVVKNPIWGVGPGLFLVNLPDFLPHRLWLIQPVHNAPLLILTELGIAGLVLYGWLVKSLFSAENLKNKRFLALFLAVFLTAMTDHYWITSLQNRILLGLISGVYLSKTLVFR